MTKSGSYNTLFIYNLIAYQRLGGCTYLPSSLLMHLSQDSPVYLLVTFSVT